MNIILFLSIIIFAGFFNTGKVLAVPAPNFQLQIITVCGNNVKEPGERCDGMDLNGFTCDAFGFYGGNLGCSSACEFDTSACTTKNGKVNYVPPATSILFQGQAYPNSTVTLLKDGQIISTGLANANAYFQITISDISEGNYTFGIYSEDSQGNRSPLTNFSGAVISDTANVIGNIFIAPTIVADKNEVKTGEKITISGQSTPSADISISVISASGTESIKVAEADFYGKYSYALDIADLSAGAYEIKAKASLNGAVSPASSMIDFTVGEKNIPTAPADKCDIKADLNNDCKVNLIDFSIAAFWYKKPLSEAVEILEKAKLNGDGIIDIVDFSIMAFNWTG